MISGQDGPPHLNPARSRMDAWITEALRIVQVVFELGSAEAASVLEWSQPRRPVRADIADRRKALDFLATVVRRGRCDRRMKRRAWGPGAPDVPSSRGSGRS
jgi:hypothetical protein